MAGGGGSDGDSRSLEQTPTWAFAIVCLAFVVISILLEAAINLVAKWLKKRRKKSLSEALEKVKAELMLLGFISLLLTVGQKPISKICISESLGDSLLPCSKEDASTDDDDSMKFSLLGHHRKLMLGGGPTEIPQRRILAENVTETGYCGKQGKVPLISQDGLNQLHIFVFVLAVIHVLSCIFTLALGQAKMHRWKAWEQETTTMHYEFSNDPARFRFTRQTTFGKRHMSFLSRTPVLIWIVCFFRQFVRSVPRVDYLTLRHGFILAHFAPNSSFDFRKYIKRSLEYDFNVIVSISPPLWLFAVLFLLLNRHGWFTYFWLSFVPLIILLIVGTKLQVIITKMALEIQGRNPVVQGPPVVKPNDKLFWFGRPRWILYLIHFTLFENAFQFAYFFWTWYEYGLNSCFHERKIDIASKLGVGIVVHILCSYVTLPLYALVTQMGTNMKTTIFDERIAESLKRWHQSAKRNLRRNRRSGNLSSGQTTPIQGLSPVHLLQNYKSARDLESAETSPRRFEQSEYELSDFDTDTTSPSYHSRFHATPLDINSGFHNNRETTEQHSIPGKETSAVEHLNNDNGKEQPDTQAFERNSFELSFNRFANVKDQANVPVSMHTCPSSEYS